MEIADWRQRIDALDRELVELLNQRCRYALAIGEEKRARGLAITEAGREAEVLDHACAASRSAGGPLREAAMRRIFTAIVAEMRGVQELASGAGCGLPPGNAAP